jgi:hypothetical protein
MKPLKIVILSFAIILSGQINSQTTYLVGASQASIEPEQSTISLHLGGYGAPRDGRFSLQWKSMGTAPETTFAGQLNGKICLISNNEILQMDPDENHQDWKKVGDAATFTAIAGVNNIIYAINNKGELFKAKTNSGSEWVKIGLINSSANLLTASENTLYAASGSGTFWSADLSEKKIKWKQCEIINSISDVISIAANKGKLYSLTNDGIIYQTEPGRSDNKWLKIAYRNNQTIKEDIRHIAISGDRIYGLCSDNFIYRGEHRSDGNLSARAIAIKAGDKTAIIVNVDLCGLTDSYTGWLKKDIFKSTGIPASAVFINSAHTHFAPVSQEWLTWQEANQLPDSNYLYSTVRNGIINSIEEALANRAPAKLSFGRGKTDIGYNRSLKDHPELYDSSVDVIKVNYIEDKKESYLFLAACHPVFSTAGKLHYTLSANYPGVARELTEKRTGSSNSIFLQGTAGDINPVDNGEYITGERLSNEVIAVLNRYMTKVEGPISYYLDTINIPIVPMTIEEIKSFRAENTGKTGDVYAEKNVRWCDLMLQYYRENKMPSSLPVYVNTINIGSWKLVGFSRETTTAYNFGVKNIWPGQLVSVAGYTNDVSSYLPAHMHIEARGYEGLDSFFWYGMPAVFPADVDEVILARVKSLKR